MTHNKMTDNLIIKNNESVDGIYRKKGYWNKISYSGRDNICFIAS